ncbi:MAG: hypothetical protein R3F62_29000 [Planctomycetota bacterium]
MSLHGKALYGRVDSIPGVGYVATTFEHYLGIPVYPDRSYFLPHGAKGWDLEHQGIPIWLSKASVVRGYLEGVCIGLCVYGGLVAAPLLSGDGSTHAWVGATALSVGLLAFAVLKLWPRRASYARAVELVDQVGLSARARIDLELAYDQISPEEAESRRAALNEKVEDLRAARASARLERRAAHAPREARVPLAPPQRRRLRRPR